jgi:hypothetical protein
LPEEFSLALVTELAVAFSLAKFPAPLRCGATKTSSMGTPEYLSPDQQRMDASFLSAQVWIFLKKIQDLAPEALTTAQPAEDKIHAQSKLINTFRTHP